MKIDSATVTLKYEDQETFNSDMNFFDSEFVNINFFHDVNAEINKWEISIDLLSERTKEMTPGELEEIFSKFFSFLDKTKTNFKLYIQKVKIPSEERKTKEFQKWFEENDMIVIE